MGITLRNKNKIIVSAIISVLIIFGLYIFSNTGDPMDKIIENADSDVYSTYLSLSPRAQTLYLKQSDQLTKEVPERLIELDSLTIGCYGPDAILAMAETDTNLGGQCCGVLYDIEAYNAQIDALNKFIEEEGDIEIIPHDPYDISVEDAQILIQFDSDISLSAEQQGIYEAAVTLSHHGGPCCCKCWKWYAMSGLGKKLIVDHGWNAEQLAELWDLSSSCGHKEDTNMFEHYDMDDEHADEHV